MKFVEVEFESIMEYKKLRKSQKNIEHAIQETLSICRSWLAEDRIELTIDGLESFRTSALYFRALKPV
jgi:hypothetical protein